MVSINTLVLILIFPPLILTAILLDRSARKIFIFLLFGIFAAFLSGQINTIFFANSQISDFDASVHYIPIIEEFIKAFPVVAYVFVLSPKRKESIEYGVALGLGFALFENICAFIKVFDGEVTLQVILFVLSRGFGGSLVHSLCTAILAYGISLCMKRRKVLLTGTFALFALVCLFHSLFNVLVGSEQSFLAIVLTLVTYVIVLILFKRIKKIS